MNKRYAFLICLLPFFAEAQNTTGKVTYEETIQFDLSKIKLEGVDNADAIKAMMPKSNSAKKVLLFNPQATLYKSVETEEADAPIEDAGEGVQIKMVMSHPEEQVYRNLQTGHSIEKKDLFGKQFLINSDEQAKKAWKLLDDEKQILGYTCKKASYSDSSSTIEAWYAPSIPVISGPETLGQLPGLILAVSMDEGKLSIEAKDIKMGGTITIEEPKKGKAVTKEEFKKIAAEKAKEMGETMGGKGGTNIIIRQESH